MSGPNAGRAPVRRAISVTNGPTFLAPFARSAAPPQPSSRRPPTPKSCPCISKKSGTTSHRARTQPLFSTALDIISPPASPYPATSHLFTSRPTHPSSTRSKTSGNICAATSSPTRSTKITTISSKKPAKHGCSSPTTRSRSLQSPHANGQRSIFSAVGIIHRPGPSASGKRKGRPGGRPGCRFVDLLLLRRPGILALGLDVAVDELDHRLRGAVAVTEASLEHAGIAALAVLVARADHVEQFLDHGDVAHFRDRLAARGKAALLGQRDHFFHDRAKFLRLRQGSDDLLVLDQRGGHVGEHGGAMRRMPAELAVKFSVTHRLLSQPLMTQPRRGLLACALFFSKTG